MDLKHFETAELSYEHTSLLSSSIFVRNLLSVRKNLGNDFSNLKNSRGNSLFPLFQRFLISTALRVANGLYDENMRRDVECLCVWG